MLDHFLSTTWHGQLLVVQVSMFKLKNSYSYPQPYRYLNSLLLYFVLYIRSRHVRQNSRTNKRKKDRWASGRYIYLTHFVECHKKNANFFLVIVPFVDAIKWGYLHMLFINMRIWLNYFDHRWRQFFPLVCEQ